ncbi:hypothetical protein [Spirulina major]|uniref:hypothetical protein n=1 Tax=Spirulina major TaxID=270636 RepID=UPI0011147080|nr:hypothetical protein [Spirulina major]
MKTAIEKIMQTLHDLPEARVLEVLDFVERLSWDHAYLNSSKSGTHLLRDPEEFEAIADRIANEFQTHVGATQPALSDYAVSRAGIYEEHP